MSGSTNYNLPKPLGSDAVSRAKHNELVDAIDTAIHGVATQLDAHAHSGGTVHLEANAVDAGFMPAAHYSAVRDLSLNYASKSHVNDDYEGGHQPADATQPGFMTPVHMEVLNNAADHLTAGGGAHTLARDGEDGGVAGFMSPAQVTDLAAAKSHLAPNLGTAHTLATKDYAGFMSTTDRKVVDAAQRPATIFVAAADALQAVKDAADYVCTGTNDEVKILAAIDALPFIPFGSARYLVPGQTGGNFVVQATRPGTDGNDYSIEYVAGSPLAVTVTGTAIKVTYPSTTSLSTIAAKINQIAGELVHCYNTIPSAYQALPTGVHMLTGGSKARAGRVMLSEGNFYIYQPIRRNDISRVTLSGNQSNLRLVDTGYVWGVEDGTIRLDNCSHCTIEGLTFYGAGGYNEIDGIIFTGHENRIRDCHFIDIGQDGIDGAGDRNLITTCTSRACGGALAVIRDGYDWEVSNCSAEGDSRGIDVDTCRRVSIANNRLNDVKTSPGISLTAVNAVSISGNHIINPAQAGVYAVDSSNVQVVGNAIIHVDPGTEKYGVRFTGTTGDYLVVSGNIIACPSSLQYESYGSTYDHKIYGSDHNLRHGI